MIKTFFNLFFHSTCCVGFFFLGRKFALETIKVDFLTLLKYWTGYRRCKKLMLVEHRKFSLMRPCWRMIQLLAFFTLLSDSTFYSVSLCFYSQSSLLVSFLCKIIFSDVWFWTEIFTSTRMVSVKTIGLEINFGGERIAEATAYFS